MINNQHVLKKEATVYRKLLCCAVLLTGFLIQGQAMAFSKTLYLFSAVEGTVLLNGLPVEGVEVEQDYLWHWKDEKGLNKTSTDSQGYFRFPAITGRSLTAGFMPHEPVITQNIRLRYQGKEYEGWYHSKRDYENLGELDGRPIRLKCDLNDEPGPHPEINSFGICTSE